MTSEMTAEEVADLNTAVSATFHPMEKLDFCGVDPDIISTFETSVSDFFEASHAAGRSAIAEPAISMLLRVLEAKSNRVTLPEHRSPATSDSCKQQTAGAGALLSIVTKAVLGLSEFIHSQATPSANQLNTLRANSISICDKVAGVNFNFVEPESLEEFNSAFVDLFASAVTDDLTLLATPFIAIWLRLSEAAPDQMRLPENWPPVVHGALEAEVAATRVKAKHAALS
jgi:hypothetical protein